MNNMLIIIDMQNDFIDGALGTKEAQAILPNVIKLVQEFDGEICYTLDTHQENYLETSEGRHLPVKHCVDGTKGHMIAGELEKALIAKNAKAFKKPTFGSVALAEYVREKNPDSVTLAGVCTDICVISNALLIKAYLPELDIKVMADCCAGVTPEKHIAALETMASCQVEIIQA